MEQLNQTTSETPSLHDQLSDANAVSSGLPADEPDTDQRPSIHAVMAELEADADFVNRMEAIDDARPWPELPVLTRITSRCVKLNPAAWGVETAGDTEEPKQPIPLPSVEYLWRRDQPRPRRFIVKATGTMKDSRMTIRVEQCNACLTEDNSVTILIDCPECEYISVLGYLMDKGFTYTESVTG